MSDYLYVIAHLPLSLFEGGLAVWWFIGDVIPHYSWNEYGQLLKSFVWLIPARIAYGVLFPERVVMKKVRGRIRLTRKSKIKPSKSDHQMAAAAINTILHH